MRVVPLWFAALVPLVAVAQSPGPGAAALSLTGSVTPSLGSPGQQAAVALTVQAGPFGAQLIEVALQPSGMRLLPGTVQVQGQAVPGAPQTVPVGRLGPLEQAQVSFRVQLLFSTSAPELTATAQGLVTGQWATSTPLTLVVGSQGGELGGNGGIYGRVCYDLDGDGLCSAFEPAAGQAVVFMEDGSHAQSDARGRFYLSPVLPGRHVLLAGPGPLSLGLRPGSFPALPRKGSARALVFVPAGQTIGADIALPVPKGFDPGAFAELGEDEEPALPEIWAPRRRGEPAPGLQEGSLDQGGSLVGFEPHPAGANPGQLSPFPRGGAPGAPFQPEPSPPMKVAVEQGPGESPQPSSAVLGLADATFHLDFDHGLHLLPAGRLALTLQDDFGDLGRATLIVDTAREGPVQTLALLDPRVGYSDFGDDARVTMSTEEKLYLRLDLPQMSLQLGRMGTALRENELLYLEESYVGLQAAGEVGPAQLRAFAGFGPDAQHREEFPGAGGIGPFALSAPPILAGSEQVDVEIRSTTGQMRQRIPQQRGVDYYLDLDRGVVELARPLPATDLAGDPVFLVVRYQSATDASLATGFLAGARAQVGSGSRHVGLSLLHESPQAGGIDAVAADGALSVGRLALDGSAGFEPTASGPLLDRSAVRARAEVDVLPGLHLFGYGLSNGLDWQPVIRSDPLPAAMLSPFPLLGPYWSAQPIASLALLEQRQAGLPAFLPEDKGHLEYGTGAWAQAGPVSALTLVRHLHFLGSAATPQDSTELAVRGAITPDAEVYAAQASRTSAGDLLRDVDPQNRQTLLGARGSWGGLLSEADYRNLVDSEQGDRRTTQDLVLETRYGAWKPLQPGVYLEQSWTRTALGTQLTRQIGAGLESQPLPALRLFGYGLLNLDPSPMAPRQTAFAGAQLAAGPDAHLTLRYDLAGSAHHLSWDGRYRLLPDWTVQSDGDVQLGGGARLMRLSSAFTPASPLSVLARVQDELALTGGIATDTRLGSVDASLKLFPWLRVDGKYLEQWQLASGRQTVAGLTGLAVDALLPHGFDVLVGGRYLRDGAGPAWGGYAEVAVTLGKVLRVGGGFNLAARPEVFTLNNQTPGFYLTLTGVEGGPLAAKAAVSEEVELARAPRRPGVGHPAPPAPSTQPLPSRRTVRGHLYGDRNHNGQWDPGEPVLEGVKVALGGVEAVTDVQGAFELKDVPGTDLNVRVVEPDQLPFTYLPVEDKVLAAAPDQAQVNLLLPKPRYAGIPGLPFTLPSAKGPVKAFELDRVEAPLAAWVAGLPLSAREAREIGRLAERAGADPANRLIILAHAQTIGRPDGAVKRALKGARFFKRYLQAAQMVPGNQIAIGVLEPEPGVSDPLGHVDLILVRVLGHH